MAEDGVRLRATVTLNLPDEKTARAVASATSVDNPRRGLSQRARGRTVELRASAASARSLRETLDDWLRCATAAAEAARRAR